MIIKLKKISFMILFCSLLILSTLSIASAVVSEDPDILWSQFQHNSLKEGYTYSGAPYFDPVVVWRGVTVPSKSAVSVSPVITDEMAYILISGGNLCAYDKDSGDLVWSRETVSGSLQTSIPAYGNGKVFVAVNDWVNSGYLFAFNASTGAEIWNVSVTDKNFACPVTYFENKIYVADGLKGGISTKYYYCYDENGHLLWKHANNNTAGFLWCGASIVGDYLVYPTHEGKLVSLYRNNGTLVDEVDVSSDLSFSKSDLGRIRASVSYSDGYLYTTSEYTFTEGYIWKVGFDQINGIFIDDGWGIRRCFSTSTPVVHNGRVYVGQGEHGYAGDLICINVSDGNLLWAYHTDAGVKSSPVVSVQDEMAYVYFTGAETDGSLYCLNQDGELAWQYNPPSDNGYILQGAAISEGKVFFGTDGGFLYCLEEAPHEPPVPEFSADLLAGSNVFSINFTDHSINYPTAWSWDMDNDGVIDSTDQNPEHRYTVPGVYTVILNVSNSYGNNSLTKTNYIIVEADLNPWNDIESEGSPDGTYVTLTEVIDAYNCFRNGMPAPETGVAIDITIVIDMYDAYKCRLSI
ncbi:PQQ-binding-like beta-propeller repeat protein [Methanococcoides sp. SA1]|nr:PQQ-binding-like beta-propeller repeat protein [Methanococcoides sp. SA1]